jgi:glyoxylate/hydroxypyruvate reductase A
MKTILIHPDVKGVEEFRNILSNSLHHYNITSSIEEAELSNIEVIIIWRIVPAYLSHLPNLKLILSCGSGIDHLSDLSGIPKHLPLVRLVDPYLRNRVSDYVLQQILEKYFPNLSQIDLGKAQKEIYEAVQESKLHVGIMGLGLIGSSIVQKLKDFGFQVSGWANTQKKRVVSEVYIGKGELNVFAQQTNILVCQLPLTQETKGILNINLFKHLPDGAFLINVGRGEHLVASDLLLGLKNGKLSGACLDVLSIQPLALNHPFNTIPNIKVTPHIAGYIGPDTQAPYACEVIESYFKNKKVEGIVNYKAMY